MEHEAVDLTSWGSGGRLQVGLTHIERVDAAFDEEQFLEHASHAFVTVNELLGEDDFEALEPMLCPRLLAAFKQARPCPAMRALPPLRGLAP